VKRFLTIVFVLIALRAVSQPWPGYNTSKYAGIHSLTYQPEIHSTIPSDWDINVLSTNMTFFNENFFGLDPMEELSSGNIEGIGDISINRNGLVNAVIQFPSVAFRLNEKSTLGFSWRVRAVMVSTISGNELRRFLHNIENSEGDPVTFNNEFATGMIGTWGSYGFFYSREILNINRHQLFAGLTFNILSGSGSAYLDLPDLSFTYADGILSDVNLSFRMAITDEIDEFINDDKIPLFSKIGYGADLGFNYIRKDKTGDDYLYKIGLGVVGFGKINYNTTKASNVNVRIDQISQSSFSNIGSFAQLMDTLTSNFEIDHTSYEKISTRLPLNINLYGDVRLHDRFYIHLAYNRQITYFGNEKFDRFCYNQFYVVPKYETKSIGIYLPFTYNKFLNLESGVAFRWKPLVIGSGNIFSYLIQGSESTNLDIYLATRIMINRKHK
jgi:hypothetical protein